MKENPNGIYARLQPSAVLECDGKAIFRKSAHFGFRYVQRATILGKLIETPQSNTINLENSGCLVAPPDMSGARA
jgi:hypothetical protein